MSVVDEHIIRTRVLRAAYDDPVDKIVLFLAEVWLQLLKATQTNHMEEGPVFLDSMKIWLNSSDGAPAGEARVKTRGMTGHSNRSKII